MPLGPMLKIILLASWLVVLGTVTVLLNRSTGQHQDRRDDVNIYRYPPALLSAVLLVVPIPVVLGGLIYWSWTPSRPTGLELACFLVFFGGGTLAAFLGYWYCRVFRVELSDGALTIHTWRSQRTIALNELIDLDVVDARDTGRGGGRYLYLYQRNGDKLRIAGGLMDFGDLVASLQAKIPAYSDSAEKTDDIATIARNKRRANLLSYAGLGVIVVVYLVLWRLQLL